MEVGGPTRGTMPSWTMRPKGEHVVALVRLPRATRRQIHQAHDRGHRQEHGEGVPIQAVRHAGAVRALALPRS